MTIAEFHLAGQHDQSDHGHGGGGVTSTVAKLKSGGSVKLATGETLARSDLVQQRGGGAALLAAIDTDGGPRRVRLGVIGEPGGVAKWSAANKGATADLTPVQARALADGLTDTARKARQQNAEADAVIEVLEDGGWDPDDRNPTGEQRDLLDQHDRLTSGLVRVQNTISTPWGDVVYGIRVTDGGPGVAVAVVPDEADSDWTIDDALSDGTALDLTLAQVRALASKLRSSAGSGQTAAVDTFQGDIPEQLADYWLRGKGAARVRWCTRGSFRRARRLLRGKVPAEMLDGTVANLYHRACGRWPGRRGNEAALAADSAVMPPAEAIDRPDDIGDVAAAIGEDGYTRVYWSGPLAPIDIATGDRRKFAPGALSTRQLPLPFRWQEKAAQGHDGAVVVGSLTGYDMAEDGTILGRGYFLDPEIIPDVRKAMHLVEHGVIGPSVDLEPAMDVTWVDEQGEEFDTQQCQVDGTCPDKPEALITAATIAGATLVPITAFAEARAPRLSDHADFCLDHQEGEDVGDNNQMASTSLTACGCASRAGVAEFSVATDGSTCACDPDGVARPMSAGGEFCACASSQTAAVRSDFDDMPIASRDMAWDVGNAEAAISRWATDADGDVNFGRYGEAFIYRDPDADPKTKAAYKFPVATVLDGQLTIVPRAVFAAAGRLNQANVSSDAREQIRETLTDLYDQMAEEFDDDSIEAPWEMGVDEEDDFDTPGDGEEVYGDAVHGGEFCGTCGGDPLEQVAAAYGVFGDIPPYPIEAFQRVADGPTPMTVLEDGSVFGHIAAWDSCNRGVRGRCVPPPKSKTNYTQFHTVPIRTSEGTLRVGKIVMGEGHADVNGNIQVTRAFYDKAGKTAAHGRAHEDQWGIFFSGVIGPNLTPAEAVEFFSMPPSGHWTEHRPTRSSELIAVAAVNVQGHPIGGPDLVLNQVASGYYEPEEGDPIEDAAAVFAILDQADWHAEAATLAENLF
jgi:hypothetical protein